MERVLAISTTRVSVEAKKGLISPRPVAVRIAVASSAVGAVAFAPSVQENKQDPVLGYTYCPEPVYAPDPVWPKVIFGKTKKLQELYFQTARELYDKDAAFRSP